jgi:Icc-related predicted phosphoesterase
LKLLLVSDLHYTLRQWDWLGLAADRFDLVVVAGDLLDLASIVPLEAQIIVVRKYLARLAAKGPLLVSSGNHDLLPSPEGQHRERDAAWLRQDPPAGLSVDGDSVACDEFLFSILPWWDGPQTRAAVEEQLETQAPLVQDKRWIWIYHPPPSGSPTSWNGRRDYGDTSLPGWIDRYHPFLVLGGHIHSAPFYAEGSWIDVLNGTWVFNSGQQTGGIPTFTIIDLAANQATWVSAAETERADLREPLERRPLE